MRCSAYRKAIDRRDQRVPRWFGSSRKEKGGNEQRKLAEAKSNTDSTIKIQNAAKAERESPKSDISI